MTETEGSVVTKPKYLKARRSCAVLLEDHTSERLEPGQPIEFEKLQQHIQDKFAEGDPWYHRLLEVADETDYSAWVRGLRPEPDKDFVKNRLQEMEHMAIPPPDGEYALGTGDEFVKELQGAGVDQDAMLQESLAARRETEAQLEAARIAQETAETKTEIETAKLEAAQAELDATKAELAALKAATPEAQQEAQPKDEGKTPPKK